MLPVRGEKRGVLAQGLLSWYFKLRFTKLPRIYNLSTMLCACHKALWDSLKAGARIVHYTVVKPGKSRESDMQGVVGHPDPRVTKDLQEPLVWWWDAYEAMGRDIGWNETNGY